ncbi:MAG: hypothetical protein H0U77_03695 [Nocardioidaceae bacterium]|nr:hypothetical protein [Nocardioidaceae bacterium]
MADHHDSTPAAWTAVALALVGFTVGGVGLVIGPNWPTFWVGLALIVVSPLIGRIMATAGIGSDTG